MKIFKKTIAFAVLALLIYSAFQLGKYHAIFTAIPYNEKHESGTYHIKFNDKVHTYYYDGGQNNESK